MDITATYRSRAETPSAPVSRPEVKPAAEVELAPQKTVAPAGASEGANQPQSGRSGESDVPQRDVKQTTQIDPETLSMVVKSVDSSTGSVVVQFPTDTILQLRAYYQKADQENSSAEHIVEREA